MCVAAKQNALNWTKAPQLSSALSHNCVCFYHVHCYRCISVSQMWEATFQNPFATRLPLPSAMCRDGRQTAVPPDHSHPCLTSPTYTPPETHKCVHLPSHTDTDKKETTGKGMWNTNGKLKQQEITLRWDQRTHLLGLLNEKRRVINIIIRPLKQMYALLISKAEPLVFRWEASRSCQEQGGQENFPHKPQPLSLDF